MRGLWVRAAFGLTQGHDGQSIFPLSLFVCFAFPVSITNGLTAPGTNY